MNNLSNNKIAKESVLESVARRELGLDDKFKVNDFGMGSEGVVDAFKMEGLVSVGDDGFRSPLSGLYIVTIVMKSRLYECTVVKA